MRNTDLGKMTLYEALAGPTKKWKNRNTMWGIFCQGNLKLRFYSTTVIIFWKHYSGHKPRTLYNM